MKEGILQGDRFALSKAITWIEKDNLDQKEDRLAFIDWANQHQNESFRFAVTGAPGVGKSSFIEALGEILLAKKLKIAILTIDPSSRVSKGSILGDKTRMNRMSRHESVFIRPSPAGLTLGGVAKRTRESILLCERAGYDVIIIETVGVGQSETLVHSMVDCLLLLLQPGEGDELQGIKKGIVELSDIIVINKADAGREKEANQTKRDYLNALHYSSSFQKDWKPEILTCSALEETGIKEVWSVLARFFAHLQQKNRLSLLRMEQSKYWFQQEFRSMLVDHFFQDEKVMAEFHVQLKRVMNSEITAFHGAQILLKKIIQ